MPCLQFPGTSNFTPWSLFFCYTYILLYEYLLSIIIEFIFWLFLNVWFQTLIKSQSRQSHCFILWNSNVNFWGERLFLHRHHKILGYSLSFCFCGNDSFLSSSWNSKLNSWIVEQANNGVNYNKPITHDSISLCLKKADVFWLREEKWTSMFHGSLAVRTESRKGIYFVTRKMRAERYIQTTFSASHTKGMEKEIFPVSNNILKGNETQFVPKCFIPQMLTGREIPIRHGGWIKFWILGLFFSRNNYKQTIIDIL